jgi:hypothetical protein
LEVVDTLKYNAGIKFVRLMNDKVRLKPQGTPYVTYHDFFFNGLAVIEEDEEWYKVVWEKERYAYYALYVDKKEALDELNFPLNAIDGWMVNIPSDSVEIISISKEEYLRMEKKAVNHFITSGKEWQDPRDFSMKIKGKKIHFNAHLDDTAVSKGGASYFLGYSRKLNSYLVDDVCYPCEDSEYLLYNKSTGKMSRFPSFPEFSRDKKLVMCLKEYDSNLTELKYYGIVNDSLKLLVEGRSDWKLVSWHFNHAYGFWGKDNWYYLTVLPKEVFWKKESSPTPRYARENLDPKYNFRYVKIKIRT